MAPRLFPPPHVTTDLGHGRIERRTVSASTALNGYLTFPHVAQVVRVERISWKKNAAETDQTPIHSEVSFYITSLTEEQAGPARLGELIRGHWGIESRHYVRDRAFREDESQIRKGAGPQLMAMLRNTAGNLLKRLKVRNISQALRVLGRHPEWVCAVLCI